MGWILFGARPNISLWKPNSLEMQPQPMLIIPALRKLKREHSCWVWDQPKTKAKHWGLGAAVKPLKVQAWGPEFEHQNHIKELGVAPNTSNPSPRETETTGSLGLLASQPANLESSRFRWRVTEDIQQWLQPSTCMCSHVHINIYAHKPNKNNNNKM